MTDSQRNGRAHTDMELFTRSAPVSIQDVPFPLYLTPFIGRRAEVDELVQRLNNPHCRLLTLVGAGGIGKTRLATQAAAQLRVAGRAVVFVDLQPVQTADLIYSAIIDGLDLLHSSQSEPQAQLFRFLRDKEMVLVLDNFEHLLEGVGFLSHLLRAAPRVKILATSRVVLNLQEEWLHAVGGLQVPDINEPIRRWEEIAGYDAVQLFVSCAQRVRPQFRLAQEAQGVVRVCQLVEGMPLAIELAAAWAKTLTADAIAEEIERDLAFLTTTLHNVPDKHRNMQAVFERSWKLLDADARAIFKRLSVFRGGFDRKAAEQVADASLSALAALVDQSLLRWRANGRYEIHELLRQYAQEKLARLAQALRCTRDRHCTYYANFLHSQVEELTTQQRAALIGTEAELDNIRVAWQWAIREARVGDIRRAAMPFFAFCQGQSRYLEGAERLAAAAAALLEQPPSPERERGLADLLTGRGWLELRLGRLQEATEALETARERYAVADFAPEPVMGADPLAALPLLAVIRGEYVAAARLGEEAWQAAASRNDRANLALAGYGLTSAAIAQGHYQKAHQLARQTLVFTQSVGNRWFLAYVYNHLGEITQALGNFTAAKRYYQDSYTIREEFDDPEGMAVALTHLGEIALLAANPTEAQALYQQSLAIYEGIGDRGGLVRALHGLGIAIHHQGKEDQARRYLRRALQTAMDTQLAPIMLSVLVGIGTFLSESGAPEWGVATWSFIQRHPSSDQRTKDEVRRLLEAQQEEIPATVPVDLSREDGVSELASLVNALLAALSASPLHASEALSTTVRPVPKADQPLVEPLSEREQEVLALIAEGLKNQEIAEQLYVTLSTVKAHCNNIYRKLDVNNRVQAVSRAREMKLL